jgi:tetratricopeptide (TPR) repeat protein
MPKICFINMPFDEKDDPVTHQKINFNQIYEVGIKPVVIKAGLECIRGDEERTGGIIHKAMFARLLLSDFVIADLTTANPNVFYELGIRHATKPYTTIPIFAKTGDIPFDVSSIRAIPYNIVNGLIDESTLEAFQTTLLDRIKTALDGPIQEDSPLFQLFDGLNGIEISHELCDVFRDRVQYSQKWKDKFLEARSNKTNEKARMELKKLENELGDLKLIEGAILVDLMLSYRDVSAWDDIISLYDKLSADVQNATIVRQQYALALNRAGNSEKAINICNCILNEHGGSAETFGILGRIYKDMYKKAKNNNAPEAVAYLQKAIDTYTKGFEIEPVDYYPGINAIMLSFILGTEKALKEIERLVPLVSFAVARRGGVNSSDYWDLATTLTLAVLNNADDTVDTVLPKLLAAAKHAWMAETTADDFEKIMKTLQNNHKDVSRVKKVYDLLRSKENELKSGR